MKAMAFAHVLSMSMCNAEYL